MTMVDIFSCFHLFLTFNGVLILIPFPKEYIIKVRGGTCLAAFPRAIEDK